MSDTPPTPPEPTPQQPGQPARFRVEIPNNVNHVYANMVMVTHTANEVLLDMGHLMPPDTSVCRVQQRIILNPANAKRLMLALADNLRRYEARFGEIKIAPEGPSLADQLFRPPPPSTNPTAE